MELKAILFDLDNTLLKYHGGSDLFLEKVLASLFNYIAQFVSQEKLAPALEKAWEKLDVNDGAKITNAEIYFQSLSDDLGLEPSELKNIFENYYFEVFADLATLTTPMPGARSAVEWAFNHGLQVVIATGIHALKSVHEQRLEWAGVPSSEYEYGLITSMSNMHASKPYVAYYKEILDYIGKEPNNCVMIGDMWEDDIVPATSIGIYGYWFTESDVKPPQDIEFLIGYGDLGDFLEYLRSLDI
jgi:FMN phosphatase YigB (HAD superfamily)